MTQTNQKIKIYQLNNGYYSFLVDEFSSLHHFIFTSDIKSMYKYAWNAYKDAKKTATKYPNLSKIASTIKISEMEYEQDVNEYGDLVITNSSADNMLYAHYDKLYDALEQRAQGIPKDDHDQAIIAYNEIKNIVSAILKVKDQLEQDKDKNKDNDNNGKIDINESRSFFDKILHKFSRLTKKYFNAQLEKDIKKMEEAEKEKEAIPEAPQEGLGGPEEAGGPEVSKSMSSVPEQPAQAPAGPPAIANRRALIKTASLNDIDNKISVSIKEFYCDRICNALKAKHNGIIAISGNRKIVIKDNDEDILDIHLGNNLLISHIGSVGKLSKIYPESSIEFYQRYWKPIVEAVKHHYFSAEDKLLIVEDSLPDLPKEMPYNYNIKMYDIKNKINTTASINFCNKSPSLWIFDFSAKENIREAKSVSKYTEQDYIQNGKPAVVMCTDPNLKSVYRKTGQVIQVIPYDGHVEVDVDFGHHTIRLTENQLEIINVD
jgi:hypothetical protein